MKPSQVAEALRHIASKIQNSKQPIRKLVAEDLQQVLSALDTEVPEIAIVKPEAEKPVA